MEGNSKNDNLSICQTLTVVCIIQVSVAVYKLTIVSIF